MTAIQHVFRRGSVYWWRRRLELSLNTKEMELARRIAPELALASDRLLPALKSKMISPEDAKRILIQVVTEHSNYLDAITSGRDARKSRRSEAASAWAIRLYAAQGENAAIGPIEERALHAAGLDDSMIDEVRNSLEFHRTSGFARPGRQKLEGILEQYDIPLVDGHFREAESIYMRGMAAALLNTERRWSGVREDDLALVQAALSAQVVLPTATAALCTAGPRAISAGCADSGHSLPGSLATRRDYSRTACRGTRSSGG